MRTSTTVATDGVPQLCYCPSIMRQLSNLGLRRSCISGAVALVFDRPMTMVAVNHGAAYDADGGAWTASGAKAARARVPIDLRERRRGAGGCADCSKPFLGMGTVLSASRNSR